MRKLLLGFALTALITSGLGVPAFAHHTPTTQPFAGWEIDGDLDDDTGGTADAATDWGPAAPEFTDLFNTTADDSFRKGSKDHDQSTWTCGTGKAPAKDDIKSYDVEFREVDGDQYVFVNFIRFGVNGAAHVDYEFNRNTADEAPASPACPQLPLRAADDVLLTFDTDPSQKTITVRAFKWNGTTFVLGAGLVRNDPANGVVGNWDGEANIPNTEPHRIASLAAGAFGEAGLNLSDTIGEITCNEFSAVHVKTRAAVELNSELKDRTAAQPVAVGNCPESNLDKGVKNITAGDASHAPTTSAAPGDEIEYQIVYTNSGTGTATNVQINEEVPERSTLLSCGAPAPDGGCPGGAGPGTELTWTFASVGAGESVTVTFRTLLDDTFPPGTTPVDNTAEVTTNEEEDPTTDSATVNVSAAPAFDVDKVASSTSVNFGDTVTYTISVDNIGDAPGSTPVVDDYDQHHVTIVDAGGAVDDGDSLTWDSGTIEPSDPPVEFQYTVRFDKTFSTGDPAGGCGAGQFAVINTVTVDGDTDSEEVCVTAEPEFDVEKSVSDDSVSFGDTVTYTITVDNIGDAPGSTTVTDDYDQDHVTIVDAGGAFDDGDSLTWDSGTIEPSDPPVEFQYTVRFDKPFFEGDPTGTCPDGQFAVLNLVSVDGGDSDSEQVCVDADPAFDVIKDVTDNDVAFGESVTYTITVTNIGDAPGSTPVVDDYDQDHVTISGITGGGVDNGDTITWDSGVLDPGEPVMFSYTATFNKPFFETDPSCPAGGFLVANQVQVDGDVDGEDVCVTAEPELTLDKAADKTEIVSGDLITYTLTYGNDGDASATNATITEEVPDGTSFDSCTGGCTTSGDPVTSVSWDLGTVDPGETGSVTMTVTVLDTVGCEVCNVATIAADNNPSTPSDEVCLQLVPTPQPGGANAAGDAFGAYAYVLGLVDETITPVDSEHHGVGSDTESDEVISVDLPDPSGDVLHAHVLRSIATSTITADPARATQLSSAEAVGVDVLEGTVTASFVRAVASAEAAGASSSFSAAGTNLSNVVVNGVAYNDVKPNTRVGLPEATFGPGSYVMLFEQIGSTSRPTPGQLSGGTYAAELTVNAIHVVVTDLGGMLTPGDQRAEIIVSHATASADFPQTTICEADPTQAVSGHAFIAQALTNPSLLPILEGYVEIPATGGSDHQHLDSVAIGTGGDTLSAEASESDSFGSIIGSSSASSYAQAGQVCLLRSGGTCTISATLVRSQASSSAGGVLAATSSDAGTEFVDLVIAGTPISNTPAPNTMIELPGGLGFVVLNEQFCDGDGVLPTCAGSDSTGLTVRALRVVLLGGTTTPPGVQVIVAEAHADATYIV